MEGIMYVCTNWGGGCNSDVEEHIRAKEKINDEEQERLDGICRDCDSRFLIVSQLECPICEKVNLEKMIFSDGISRKDMLHRFKCSDCEEIFGIHEINLK